MKGNNILHYHNILSYVVETLFYYKKQIKILVKILQIL